MVRAAKKSWRLFKTDNKVWHRNNCLCLFVTSLLHCAIVYASRARELRVLVIRPKHFNQESFLRKSRTVSSLSLAKIFRTGPTCLYCHGMGSHAIQESSAEIIDVRSSSEGGRCAICHRAATMETVSNVYHIMVNAQLQLESSTKLYNWLETHGYKNLAMDKMYHNSRETLSQLRQTFHSFNMREINEFASSIGANAELTQDTYNMIESLEIAKARQAKLGISSVLFLLCFAGLLLIYRKKYLHWPPE